jgi:hypothetical protein
MRLQGWGDGRTLALATAPVLDLEPREVGAVLLELGLDLESAIGASNPHSKQLAETPLDGTSKRGNPHDEDRGVSAGDIRAYTYGRHLGCRCG